MTTVQSNWSASDVFSPREAEVAELAARGLTNKEISQRLGVEVDLVKCTLRRALHKVGMNNRTHLIQIFPPEEKPKERILIRRRERDVLEWISKGDCNKEIARKLGISAATVKVHLNNIFARIGVRNRTEAAVWWCIHGIHSEWKGA